MANMKQTLQGIQSRCTEEGDCWIWKQGTDGAGKPICRHDGKTVYVRRLVRELTDGRPVNPSLGVMAKCGNLLCVSYKCSVVGSAKKRNQMAAKNGGWSNPDRIAKIKATKRAKSKISDQMVREIIAMPGPSRVIAEATGVNVAYVKKIRSGKARILTTPFSGLVR